MSAAKPTALAVVYRGGDEAARLRAEIADLRAQLARLRDEALPLFDNKHPCRKCGESHIRVTTEYVAAVHRGWWRAAQPERMRRKCNGCGAVWHERPLDASEGT